jgi:hypothetical protein
MDRILVYVYEVRLVEKSMRPCAEECCRCSTAPESLAEMVVVRSVNNVSTEIRLRRLASCCLREWLLRCLEIAVWLAKVCKTSVNWEVHCADGAGLQCAEPVVVRWHGYDGGQT